MSRWRYRVAWSEDGHRRSARYATLRGVIANLEQTLPWYDAAVYDRETGRHCVLVENDQPATQESVERKLAEREPMAHWTGRA